MRHVVNWLSELLNMSIMLALLVLLAFSAAAPSDGTSAPGPSRGETIR